MGRRRGGSPDESAWQYKVDLAAAVRLADRFGLSEGISNHFTYALDEAGEGFLLHAFGLHWSEVRASDILTVDADGNALRRLLDRADPSYAD